MTLSNLSNTLEQIKVAQASDAALRQQLGSILAHATGADGGVGAEDAERLAEIVTASASPAKTSRPAPR